MRRLHVRVTCLLAAAVLLGACTSTAASSGTSSSASSGTSSAASSGASSTASSIPPTAATTTAPPPASTTVASSALPTPGPEVLTPVLGAVQDRPVPVTGTDGRVYLAYELYLTNATSTPVTIDSVRVVAGDVLDDSPGATLQEFSGADLVAHTRVIGAEPSAEPATTVTLQGGQLGVIWLDPSVDDAGDVPQVLDHVVAATFAQAPNPLIPAEVEETIARTQVGSVPAAVIASPLDGPDWLNGNGCCSEVTPHRGALNPINGSYYLAERFAIDWVQLDADGRVYSGDRTALASYGYYGAPIFAVADGQVVAVYDELPDETPGANPPVGKLQVTQFGGNYVVQHFTQDGQDYYAFYAHLKPGSASAAVQVGQQITAGQQVGELGNSGNSDAPHLHFHVMDGPNPLASDGLPYVFDELTMAGRAADPAAVDEAATTGVPLELAPDGPTGPRTGEMPLWMDVVDLTAGG